jgi:hypothetical protein
MGVTLANLDNVNDIPLPAAPTRQSIRPHCTGTAAGYR